MQGEDRGDSLNCSTAEVYGLISEAKITGLIEEAEDEAEASPLINITTVQSLKGHCTGIKVVFLLHKLSHIPFPRYSGQLMKQTLIVLLLPEKLQGFTHKCRKV